MTSNSTSSVQVARLVEISVVCSEAELVLGAEDSKAMADSLLDLWLEGWVLFQQLLVRLAAKLGVLIHVLNCRSWVEACAHEAGGASLHLGELVEVIANILALVQHIHHLLDLRKLGTNICLVKVWLHD